MAGVPPSVTSTTRTHPRQEAWPARPSRLMTRGTSCSTSPRLRPARLRRRDHDELRAHERRHAPGARRHRPGGRAVSRPLCSTVVSRGLGAGRSSPFVLLVRGRGGGIRTHGPSLPTGEVPARTVRHVPPRAWPSRSPTGIGRGCCCQRPLSARGRRAGVTTTHAPRRRC
jgi:hypothetical protein